MQSFFKDILLIISCSLICVFSQENNSQFYNQVHSFRIEGNVTFSYYYTYLYVGTPPQKQSVILDTGSHILAFPCSDCKEYSCGDHISNPFDIFQSYTIDDINCQEKIGEYTCDKCAQDKCQWGISYAEGSSLKGHMMSDYIVMGQAIDKYLDTDYKDIDLNFVKYLNRERVKVPFGCTTQETNLFLSQDADGILGLSSTSNTNIHWPNILDQYYQKHSANPKNNTNFSFSLCYGQNGGYMSIGGYNKNLQKKNVETGIIDYISSSTSSTYKVQIDNIIINGQQIIYGTQQAIIESGTTFLLAPKYIIQAIDSNITSHCNQSTENCLGQYQKYQSNTCWQKAEETSFSDFFASFPTIEFQLSDFIFKWYPQNYLSVDPYVNNNPNLLCYAFESYSQFILGTSWMKEYDILFDRENQQIHLTESNCDPESVNPDKIEDFYENIKANDQDYELYKQITGEKLLDNHKNFDWFNLPIGGTVNDWVNYFKDFGYYVKSEYQKNLGDKIGRHFSDSEEDYSDDYSEDYFDEDKFGDW